MRRILLIGASGLVGGEIVKRLDPAALLLLSRRRTGLARSEIVAPLGDWRNALSGETIDVVISALGTTRRKAGSRSAFDLVDRVAVVAVAYAARDAGARHMIAVSAIGANAAARNFYLATKGRMEAELGAIGFDRLDLLRPGLLRGERAEHRAGEALALRLSPLIDPLLRGRLADYGSIAAADVAKAAGALVGWEGHGTFHHLNGDLLRIAHQDQSVSVHRDHSKGRRSSEES